MVFNTLLFWLFFLVVYVVYLVLPHRSQNRWLLLASYLFYGMWDWRFLSLIAFTTFVDYTVSKWLHRSSDQQLRRRLVFCSVGINLSILGVFKYAGFFIDSARDVFALAGFSLPDWQLQIILPVGISFYTFQAMSYTIDVYRKDIAPARSFWDLALYVSFFPQLVAGPIERASHLLPQVEGVRPRNRAWRIEGAWLAFWGLFKKVVIADNLAVLADSVFNGGTPMTSPYILVGIYAFAFQIYCDFSGYTDIARGVARLLGFDIMLNFNLPYIATNPSDFWRRWHISLSTWLRDYLYIPLGGNRKGPRRTFLHLIITMLLGGLWHGAAWTFVIWGLYHGVLLSAHRMYASCKAYDRLRSLRFYKLFCIVIMFHLTCLGWLFFRAENMAQVGQMLRGLAVFEPMLVADFSPWLTLGLLCLPLFAVQWLQYRTGDHLAPIRMSAVPLSLFIACLIVGILVFGNTSAPAFIYFQF